MEAGQDRRTAEFGTHARLAATLDGRRLIHSVGPRRDEFWDNALLWLTPAS